MKLVLVVNETHTRCEAVLLDLVVSEFEIVVLSTAQAVPLEGDIFGMGPGL